MGIVSSQLNNGDGRDSIAYWPPVPVGILIYVEGSATLHFDRRDSGILA